MGRNFNLPHFVLFHFSVAVLWCLANLLFLLDLAAQSSFKAFLSVNIALLSLFILVSLLLSVDRFLFIFINFLFFTIAAIISYFKLYYKIVMSTTLIQSVVNTDMREVFELLNFSIFSSLVLFVLMEFLCLYFLWRNLPKKINFANYLVTLLLSGILLVASLLLSASGAYHGRFLVNSIISFMPLNYIISITNYYSLYGNAKDTADINNIFNFTEPKNNTQNIVLVIGESARADHFGINGYNRNTTPNIQKLGNIISYRQSYSLATNTPMGVLNIMKRYGNHDATSVISVFKKLGYTTYWLSNQGARYKIITDIAKEAESLVFSDDLRIAKLGSNYDADLLPFVERAIKSGNKNFIVVHTIGSHRLYDLRYPEEFKKFTPTCIKDQLYYSVNECTDIAELNNSYDNSILYTDYFLSELISLLENTNSLVLYISDHGESLGENGVYAHAHPYELAPNEQVHVPLILWFSPKFLATPQNNGKLEYAKIMENVEIDQSYIFHSLLGCASIEAIEGVSSKKNLCAKK